VIVLQARIAEVQREDHAADVVKAGAVAQAAAEAKAAVVVKATAVAQAAAESKISCLSSAPDSHPDVTRAIYDFICGSRAFMNITTNPTPTVEAQAAAESKAAAEAKAAVEAEAVVEDEEFVFPH
jgi:hypothetical protein